VTPPRPVTTPPPRLADLSAAFRRELPTLTVSGVVYAAAASSRLAVVNGQVMREGESLPSGVTLERVFPLAAVFTYRGQRFEVAP
jgi:general secretion pathway protein B